MEVYNIALVEDDAADRQRAVDCFERYAQEHGVELSVFPFTCGETFLENYRPRYDMVFMDIMLPGINGMETAERLRQNDPEVALFFLTSTADFAIKGYQVRALDYVVKPVTYYAMAMRLETALRSVDTSRDASVALRTQDGIRVLSSRDICYVEIQNHSTMYHTVGGDYTAYGTLSECERSLASYNFVRCSSWALVNLRYVEGIYKDELQVAGQRVHISRAKRKAFMDAFSTYLGRR